LEKALGKSAIRDWRPEQPGDVPITYANIAKARNLLGYSPKVSIEKGMELFVKWLRNADKGYDG
jgi:UDP-glucuronate 4-epimerase